MARPCARGVLLGHGNGQALVSRRSSHMASITYYVALPFIRTDDGDLVAGEAQDRQTSSAAIAAAASMARTAAGAVVFSRTGDPQIGEFEDAVVLRTFGEVPSLEDLLAG